MSRARWPESDDGLRVLGQAPPVGEYLRDIWQRRAFALSLARGDLHRQSSDAALGQLWLLLNPALLVAIYYLVFERLLQVNRGVDNFLGFLVIGILFYQLTQRIATDAASAVSRNLGLVRSLQFPRILLPVAVVVKETIAFGQATVVLVVTLLLTGETPDARWLAIVPIFMVQTTFNTGAALITSQLGDRLRDTSQVLPHLFRVLLYGSGVIFSVDRWITGERTRLLFAANPMYDLVTLARWSMMGEDAGWPELIGMFAWAVGIMVLGFVTFRRAEPRFGS